MVTLTVVIPHFNHGSILPRAVASVLLSKRTDIEIIVVDDGSTDGSGPVLSALETADPSIRIIRCPCNQGAPAALNVGLAEARGRYVSFLGSDDFVLPEIFPTMIAALDRQPTAALACGEIAIIGTGGELRGVRPLTVPAFTTTFLSPEIVCRRIARTDNWILNTGAVYRTDLLRAAGGFDASLGSFCDGYVSRVLAFTHGFVFVPGIFGAWQVAANTLSSSSILDEAESSRLVTLAEERLASSAVGRMAPSYPATFARRLRFSAARMQFVWKGKAADAAAVTKAAGGYKLDGDMLSRIKHLLGFGPTGRAVALTWLALRLRPSLPILLTVHVVRNRIVRRRSAQRIKDTLATLDVMRRKLLSPP